MASSQYGGMISRAGARTQPRGPSPVATRTPAMAPPVAGPAAPRAGVNLSGLNPTQDQMLNYGDKSIFTNLGFDSGGTNALPAIAKRLGVGMGTRLASQTAFGNSLEPVRQESIKRALLMARPGSTQGRKDLEHTQNAQAVAKAVQQALLQGTGAGLSQEALAGAVGGAAQDQAMMDAQTNNRFDSPEFQMQLESLIQQIIAGGQQVDPQVLLQMMDLINGNKAANPSNPGILAGLGGIIGSGVSAYAGGWGQAAGARG